MAVIERFRLVHRSILPPPVHQPDTAKIRKPLDFLRETLSGSLERQEEELMSLIRPQRDLLQGPPATVLYS